MSAAQALSPGLQRLIGTVSPDVQAKLVELHAKFRFDEDQLECFMINDKHFSADKLPAFREFLEQERTRAALAAQPVKAGRPSMGGEAARRKPVATAQAALLSEGLSAALGRTRPLPDAEAVTPGPKRPRESPAGAPWLGDSPAGLEKGTPEPPSRPAAALPVTLKASLNERNLQKPAAPPGFGAAVHVELLGDRRLWSGGRHGAYTWMDESPESRAAARDARLAAWESAVVAAMRQRHPGLEAVAGAVGVPTQAEVVLCGRLVCEGLEGRLNERSLLLEGSRASGNGARVQLSVAECQRIAAFPGQVVGVLGRSGMAGTTFHARDFLAGLPPPASAPSASSSLRMHVLAGPFCLRDGLDYSGLERALEHAAAERPQVLVLLGPFLDAGNQKVASGEPVLPGEVDPCSFEEVYERLLLPLLLRGLAPLRRANPPTEVLIVPSLDEVLCFHPMPQPPLDVALGPDVAPAAFEQLRRLGVQFLPNPAHLRINGFTVSLTSADALSPVLREIVLRPEGRKIEEALRLLLYQRGLFPVVPRDPAQVSEDRASALDFQGGVPDVCVFPSASGTATGTVVEGTVFVNPGPLCRPAAWGSFADVYIAPANTAGAGAALRERVRVDIQKLG